MNSPIENKFEPVKLGQRGHKEVWYLKLNDLHSQKALWLRFTLLSTKNGFKRIAEVWAVYFQKTSSKEIKKIAIKQTYPMEAFSAFSPSGASGVASGAVTSSSSSVRIGESELTDLGTKGSIQSKGQSIEWNLTFLSGRPGKMSFVPEILSRAKLTQQSATTVDAELLVSGTTRVDGEIIQWQQAAGMKGHFQGPRSAHSWVWGHCNSFLNEQGKPSSFIFEGLTARNKIGPITTPRLSSFYFYYKDQDYYFNTLRDSLYLKSKNTLNEWRFQADRGELSFRGVVKAEHKDFAGLTLEDTNGSYLYCAHSELSNMKILVYRRGKLECTVTAQGSAGFEITNRNKNPYVPLLV